MADVELVISKRLAAVLPPLTDDEKAQLEANLTADGEALAPIMYWHDGKRDVIVDGMHRWPLVRKHNLPYRAFAISFDTYDDAELWILRHQLGRRNLLNPQAQRKLIGDIYNRLKKPEGRPEKLDQNDPVVCKTPQNTAEKLASELGVSAPTVKRSGQFAELLDKLPKSLRGAITAGTLKPTDAEVKRLAKADQETQIAVARRIRVGQATTLKDAMAAEGVKQAPKPKAAAKSDKSEPASTDRRKQDIPERLKPFFSPWYSETEKALKKMVLDAKKHVHQANSFLAPLASIVEHLEEAARLIGDAAPSVVCPACGGDKDQSKDCGWCRNMGYMPAWAFNDWKAKHSGKH